MKQPLLLFALLALPIGLSAQTDQPTDIQPAAPQEALGEEMSDVRSYGGYLLDMSLMGLAQPQPAVSIEDMPFPLTRDYSRMFALPSYATYSVAPYNQAFATFSSADAAYGRLHYLGPTMLFGGGCTTCGTMDLQMGSFQLSNGMRIQTYGQYNAEGYRMPNHSALPWEKNQFHGAFELKSANGAWGVRVEVQHR